MRILAQAFFENRMKGFWQHLGKMDFHCRCLESVNIYFYKEAEMRTNMKSWGMFVLVLFVILAGAGCNTMEGVGEDVERAGEGVRDAAD